MLQNVKIGLSVTSLYNLNLNKTVYHSVAELCSELHVTHLS